MIKKAIVTVVCISSAFILGCSPIFFFPDLTVTELWVQPEHFSPGQNVRIQFKVKNVGYANSGPFRVVVALDGREIASDTLNGLASGQEVAVYRDVLLWPDTRCHTLAVIVDPHNAVIECKEDNNQIARSFCPRDGGLPSLEIASVDAPQEISTGESFELRVVVRYSLPTLTGVMVQVYEHAGPLLGSQRRSLEGIGNFTFQFSLSAPVQPRSWQLNVHLFRWDGDWVQVAIRSVTILVKGVTPRPAQFYYLFPPVVHLVPGERSVRPIKIFTETGEEVHAQEAHFSATSDLVSISADGYIQALRPERYKEGGAIVTATVRGALASNFVVVRVLSRKYEIIYDWVTTEHTGLYYPSHVQGEDLGHYVAKYEIPQVNEYAYQIQASLMGSRPWGGARQIFAVEFAEGAENSPCGLGNINPLRFGWDITGGPWSNCFLVPFIPPRSPQWTVFYHELGHNFTLENTLFRKAFGGVLEYSEGLATALGLTTIEIILQRYPINNDTRRSLEMLYNRDVQNFENKYREWINKGIPFPNLPQLERNDLVDGIWLYWKGRRGGDFAHRFFSLFNPRYEATLLPIVGKAQTVEDTHTLFAAMVSAAVGQDLSSTFQNTYGFPLNKRLFDEAYQAFTRLLG